MFLRRPRHWYLLQSCSFVLVAFGQPALVPTLGLLASCIGFALHWKALDFLSNKEALWETFFWFFLVQLCQLSWMSSVSYQGKFFLVVYVALAAGMGLQFVFFTQQIRRSSCFSVLSLAACWVLLEWSRLFFLCGFTFNFVGVSLSSSIFPLQCASLFGVLGLSFLVMATNLLALKALRGKKRIHWIKWGVLFIFPYIYGALHIAYHDSKKEEDAYRGVVVQTGLLPAEKYPLAGRDKEFISPFQQWDRVFSGLSKKKRTGLDFIVFPEGVFPYGLNRKVYDKKSVQELFLRHFGLSIKESFPEEESFWVSNKYFFQVLSHFFKTEVVAGLEVQKDEKNYNSAFLFSSNGELIGSYDKRVLLPVAEYLPFSGIKGLSKLYGIEDFFTAGTTPAVWGKKGICPSICYEELFPSLIREGRNHGGGLFVNLSNDAWYPSSTLTEQHFTQGLIRTIENGVPLIRSCNTGVSAAVDSLGRVVARLSDEKAGFLYFQLPKYQYRTLFSALGELPLVLVCLAAFFLRRPFFLNFYLKKRASKALQERENRT